MTKALCGGNIVETKQNDSNRVLVEIAIKIASTFTDDWAAFQNIFLKNSEKYVSLKIT